jgi:hypothetical protein
MVLCDEGYQSSLVAATLRRFDLDAADVIGRFRASPAAGLPIMPTRALGRAGRAPVRHGDDLVDGQVGDPGVLLELLAGAPAATPQDHVGIRDSGAAFRGRLDALPSGSIRNREASRERIVGR